MKVGLVVHIAQDENFLDKLHKQTEAMAPEKMTGVQ